MEVVNSVNICRCCYSRGLFKDLKSKHQWMGEEEVYADMLQECFRIELLNTDDEECQGICEVCITQLRNASNFKKQVLNSEQRLKKHLNSKELSDKEVKLEVNDDTDCDTDFDNDPVFKVTIKDEVKIEETKSRKRPTPVASKAGAKRLKTEAAGSTKDSTHATDGLAKKKTRRKKKKREEDSATPERLEHRINLTSILQYSNASPFRDKTMNGFSCLYCCQYFKDINDLRVHTAQQSEKDKLNLMIDYKLSYNPIKLDITDLQCTVCDMEMSDLTDLKDHLVTSHNKTIHKDIKDIILPFRLEDGSNYRCVICSVVHISFKNLYHHMSSHYRNFCCNQCGAGYITIAALRKHGKTHENGNFPCEYCEKTYTSMSKKKQHEKGVHTAGWLRNKCPHCPEIFVSYYDRSEHLVEVHNETPVVYPCNACDKVYKKKFELNRHIKHHHLQQKNFKCDLCNAKFFSKRGLMDHLARHDGGEQYSCDVCGKTFTRPRSLKEHVRVHEDGKKYQCEVCQKTFMQKCSLKSHIRLHQDDLDIFKEFDDVKHLIDNRDITLKQIAEENRRKEMAETSEELTLL